MHDQRTIYGPFKRLVAAGVQDTQTLERQLRSGEIWGRAARFAATPAVKAYPGRLEPGERGIEFWTFQEPCHPHGPRIYWRSIGLYLHEDPEAEVVKLQVAFGRVTQELHDSHGTTDSPLEATGDGDQG